MSLGVAFEKVHPFGARDDGVHGKHGRRPFLVGGSERHFVRVAHRHTPPLAGGPCRYEINVRLRFQPNGQRRSPVVVATHVDFRIRNVSKHKIGFATTQISRVQFKRPHRIPGFVARDGVVQAIKRAHVHDDDGRVELGAKGNDQR